MAECEVCGHDYDKAFRVLAHDGTTHIFDSFECAIRALAPVCGTCGNRVVGHGVVAEGRVFCSLHCALASGAPAEGFVDN